jgi:hypothetical protein
MEPAAMTVGLPVRQWYGAGTCEVGMRLSFEFCPLFTTWMIGWSLEKRRGQ